jgi:hypothetical protein
MQDLVYRLWQPVPDGDAQAPTSDLSEKFNNLVGYAKYVGFGVCVLAMIAAGIMLALQHRHGEGMEAAAGPIKVMIAVAIIAGASGLVTLFV